MQINNTYILYFLPFLWTLMALSFQSSTLNICPYNKTNSLRRKNWLYFQTAQLLKSASMSRHLGRWGGEFFLGLVLSGGSCSMRGTFFSSYLEKENTAFSLPFKVCHDSELIQSQNESQMCKIWTNKQKPNTNCIF